ncbi:MAG: DUF3788 family protein [Anaeromyxobacteraceae bacterium]
MESSRACPLRSPTPPPAPRRRPSRARSGAPRRPGRSLFDRLRAEVPGLEETWRYFPDGKSWLLKVDRKGKTVCWVSVERGQFKVAFYFAARLDAALLESDLSAACKAAIRDGKPAGKLRPVPVTFGPRRGLEDVLTLVRLKATLK